MRRIGIARRSMHLHEEGSFNKWVVAMFGGLARRPEVTKDAFQFVVCHEVGHHLAGWPFAYDWASNEGQS